jgi:hypothetical protein
MHKRVLYIIVESQDVRLILGSLPKNNNNKKKPFYAYFLMPLYATDMVLSR